LHQLPTASVSVRSKILVNKMTRRPRRISGGHRQATHHWRPSSILRQAMLHIWMTVWCWDTVLCTLVNLRKATVSAMSVRPYLENKNVWF